MAATCNLAQSRCTSVWIALRRQKLRGHCSQMRGTDFPCRFSLAVRTRALSRVGKQYVHGGAGRLVTERRSTRLRRSHIVLCQTVATQSRWSLNLDTTARSNVKQSRGTITVRNRVPANSKRIILLQSMSYGVRLDKGHSGTHLAVLIVEN